MNWQRLKRTSSAVYALVRRMVRRWGEDGEDGGGDVKRSETGNSRLLQAGRATVHVTPFAMARISNDLFLMARDFDNHSRADYARSYVLCASIEVGLKSAILADECTEEHKKRIKSLGHDLIKIWERYNSIYGASLWDASHLATVVAINPFFRSKGLEYFTFDVLLAAASGGKSIPDAGDILVPAARVNEFLNQRTFFRDL